MLGLAACTARPVGDFGRAAPSWTHDVAMPSNGRALAAERGEPVSRFNQTDQERLMHDRVWRFLVASHAKDWVFDAQAELQRTRIAAPGRDLQFSTARYYEWLTRTAYTSSRTRYSTVGRHIVADLDTLPDTFAAICAVLEIDQQRRVALSGLRNLAPDAAANVAARKYENDAFIAWFVRALTYRYDSYDYALDNLLVETPHEQSVGVDDALRRLRIEVVRAQRGEFCLLAGRHRGGHLDVVIPSRYQHSGDTEVVLPK